MRGQVQTGLGLREVADGGHLLRLAHVRRRDGFMLDRLRVLLDLQLEVDRPLLVRGLVNRGGVRGQLGGVVVARGAGGARVGGGVEAARGRHAGRGAARHGGRGRVVLVVELLRSWKMELSTWV